jgi:ATP phosphoribosyltransferase
MIRIALPGKGRLAEGARSLLEQAGLEFDLRDRALQASLGDDFLALFVNARDIPEFVADGAADLGITGGDIVAESGRPVATLLDLGFGRCRLAVAAREDSGIRSLSQLGAGTRVATVFPNLARRYFDDLGCDISLVPISGAAEIAPHLGVADVIVDLVSTGSTLKVNGLVEIAQVMDSSALLITRADVLADELTGPAARELATALESVLRAQNQRYLMANVPKRSLADIRRILPGINGPTIIDVMNGGEFVAAHAVVGQREVYRTIAELKRIGAEGILVTRIERLMP